MIDSPTTGFFSPTIQQAERLEEACQAFMQAADLYSGEEVSTTSNNCKLKVAQLSAQLERYPLAVEVYEEVAKASLDNNLLKFSVKGYLLNAGICRMCSQDAIGRGLRNPGPPIGRQGPQPRPSDWSTIT